MNKNIITGAKIIDIKKNKPVKIALKPVLPPTPTPAELSIYVIKGLVPKITPIKLLIAIDKNPLSVPLYSPFSSLGKSPCLPKIINVPAVSKNIKKMNEKITIIKSFRFPNNSLNPDINANVAEVSKFKVTNSEGIIGIFIAE